MLLSRNCCSFAECNCRCKCEKTRVLYVVLAGGRHFILSSCTFFGHRHYPYSTCKDQLKNIIIDLIENKGVTEFYNGSRGDFDSLCIDVVCQLKQYYPDISLIKVLSYHPDNNFVLPKHFDESVYLLEKGVPPQYAIHRTNRRLAELVDFIISGVRHSGGGAYRACNYAKRLNKEVIEINDEN